VGRKEENVKCLLGNSIIIIITFINVNNVGVLNRAHNLHFAPDSNEIGLRFNLALFNGLDCHLLSRFFIDS
jgi:hypothetical protein